MRFYDDDNEEDNFSEDEISLANGFCEACDKGLHADYDEEEYDIIISNLMFSQKADYLKKAIERAQKDFPEDPEFVIWKIRYLIWNDQKAEAQLYMQKILRHFPAHAELYEEIAFIAYTFHLNMNVRELVLKAIAIEPSANAYFILTNLYLDKQNVEKAFDCLVEAYKYDQAVLFNIDLLILSHGNHRSNRFETELRLMEMMTQEFPLDKQVWMILGDLYSIDNRHEDAIQAFEFAKAIENDKVVTYAIAKECFLLKNYDKTIELCWSINNDKDFSVHVMLGKSFRKLGYYDESLYQLLQTKETDPEYPFAFSEIIETLRLSGRMDEIPRYIGKFYECQQLTIEKLEWVLDCLSAEENSEAIFCLCRFAVNLFESAKDYCFWLTEFCYMIHQPYVAICILTDSYTDNPDPDIYEHIGYYLALLNIADGNPKDGIQHLHNALIINEKGVHEDFLDIDTDLLYTQNPEIFMMVSPYTDHLPDIHNN